MRIATTLLAALTSLMLSAVSASAQSLDTELIGQFVAPIFAGSPSGDMERLFVVEQAGRIRIVQDPRTTPSTLPTPFLDISSIVLSGGERGLLGLAFHPDYDQNGRFFVNYTNSAGHTRVVEYAVSASDPNIANPAPVQAIYDAAQPFSNHNGGCLQFGPDGKLYFGLGDGGSGNDPGNRAQDPSNQLGKMLRLDIDLAVPFIPLDNPFVNDPATLNEIWAIGLRNPWRFSFDRQTGDMYIGDVGQLSKEEVNFQPASSTGGENYGWRCMEGTACTGLSGCTCNGIALTDPIQEFNHSFGKCSITGGYVYRGSMIPWLAGTYFYGDYCSRNVFSFEYDGSTLTNFMKRTDDLQPSAGGNIGNITSFGEDGAGELYIVAFSAAGGQVLRITEDCGASSYCTAAPNSNATSGAQIGFTGDLGIGLNNFNLAVADATANQFGFFFYGGAPTQTPLGDGFLCIGASAIGFHRLLPPGMTDATGSALRNVDFTAPPASGGNGLITSGSTYYFQYWYRDPSGPGGTGFNFSNGLQALFCP
ncbi:MAG: glucose/arabinose dehydrogenase [Planctomycetota bacterium]|jgi:glucose/arabinose dehydrogenase